MYKANYKQANKLTRHPSAARLRAAAPHAGRRGGEDAGGRTFFRCGGMATGRARAAPSGTHWKARHTPLGCHLGSWRL